MQVSKLNHSVSIAIFNKLLIELPSLSGGTQFRLGNTSLDIEGKDGLGGLIEEWFGVWAKSNGFSIYNPKIDDGNSQTFPDYFVGDLRDGYLEIKTFNADATAAFDIANFESYCLSLANNPFRLFSDYLIFSYTLNGANLKIDKIWLKKVWEITSASEEYPLKNQNKKKIIYNIRPGTFNSKSKNTRALKYPIFNSAAKFVNALYETQFKYNKNVSDRKVFERNLIKYKIDLNKL
jgi:hypothetical protein